MQTAIASRRLRAAAAAAGLLLAAAAPGLLGYAPDLLESETCLAPDFAGPDCAQFRRLARPTGRVDEFDREDADEEQVRLPLDVAALLLTSNELAGGGRPPPAARAAPRSRERALPSFCAASRHRPDRASCPGRNPRRR